MSLTPLPRGFREATREMNLYGVFGPYATLLVLFLCSLLLPLCTAENTGSAEPEEWTDPLFQTIEGKVTVDGARSDEWLWKTSVSVDGGKYRGFLKANGEFEIHGVAPGSYLVEVISPNYDFEPARIDISSKSGKVRARKVNLLKSTSVQHLSYPLKFKTGKQAEFFERREPWSIINTLKNPMVITCTLGMRLIAGTAIFVIARVSHY